MRAWGNGGRVGGFGPEVPQVVGDAPELGVADDIVGVGEWRGAGGEAEHDGTAALIEGVADHVDFVRLIGPGDAVDFEIVDAPFRVKIGDCVVIVLGGLIVLHAVIVGVPGAGVAGVSGIGGMEVGVGNVQVVVDGFAGDAVDDVDAEAKALGVDPVGQRAESLYRRRQKGSG